jgi:predicted nucleotidyltransferase
METSISGVMLPGEYTTESRPNELVKEARFSGIVSAVIIDGSYVSGKARPEDVDLLLLYRSDLDLNQSLRPFEANMLNKRWLKAK